MTRSRILNEFCKEKTEENKNAYNKQKNFCESLVRKVKTFFNNLNVKYIADNKGF